MVERNEKPSLFSSLRAAIYLLAVLLLQQRTEITVEIKTSRNKPVCSILSNTYTNLRLLVGNHSFTY